MFFSYFNREFNSYSTPQNFYQAPTPDWILVELPPRPDLLFVSIRLINDTEGYPLFLNGKLQGKWVELSPEEQFSIPHVSGFYNDLANSLEYKSILNYGLANPGTSIPLLLGVAISSIIEAKGYQQSGGNDVSFDRVQSSFNRLIQALPDEEESINKNEIINKLNELALNNHISLKID